MDNLLLIAVLGGLGAMLGWGLCDYFAKKVVDQIDDIAASFWTQFLGIFPLIVIFLFQPDFSDVSSSILLKTAFWGLVDATGYMLFFNALSRGKVSIVSPITTTYAAFSIIVSAFAFGEKLSLPIIILLLLIFVGMILASLDFDQIKADIRDKKGLSGGVPQAMIAVILFAFWFPFWDSIVSNGNSWVLLLIFLRSFNSLYMFIFSKIKKISLAIKKPDIRFLLVLMAVFDVIAFSSLTWAYSRSTFTSVISMLSAALSVPTLILANIFLKEKLKWSQWIGVVVIILGLVLVAAQGGKI